MRPDPRIVGLLLILPGCGGRDDRDGTGDTAATEPPDAPRACVGAIVGVQGDLDVGLSSPTNRCGTFALTDARVVPAGPRLDVFMDSDGSQLFPAVTAPEPAVVERVTWDGTFALTGDAPIEVAGWPRVLGDPVVEGPLGEDGIAASGACLVGRPDGGWLLVAAVGQRFDEVTVEVHPPDQIAVVWGGRDARRLERDGRAFYDAVTVVMGPDPAALLDAWTEEVTGGLTTPPFGGELSVYGPPSGPAAVASLAAADPGRRFPAVLTDGADAELGRAIDAAGRAWMVRGSPFLVDPDTTDGVLRADGVPVVVEGRHVLDPTDGSSYALVRDRAQGLVTKGVRGVWLLGAEVLAMPAERAAADQSGVGAYRLGLEAFRSGFGARPIVVEGGLPLASIGVADAVVLPSGSGDPLRIATVAAFAHGTPGWFRFGPSAVSTVSDDELAADLGLALLAGGPAHLGGPPATGDQRAWLFGPVPDEVGAVAGSASRPERPWRRSEGRYLAPGGVIVLANPGDDPVTLDGPGGRRWPVEETAPAGRRPLPPGHTEVWFPW